MGLRTSSHTLPTGATSAPKRAFITERVIAILRGAPSHSK